MRGAPTSCCKASRGPARCPQVRGAGGGGGAEPLPRWGGSRAPYKEGAVPEPHTRWGGGPRAPYKEGGRFPSPIFSVGFFGFWMEVGIKRPPVFLAAGLLQ